MRKLFAFLVTSLDGYFEGPNHEFDWPNVDDEFLEFSISQLDDIGVLVFGRTTYDGMAAYWQSDAAQVTTPAIAERMNVLPKLAISRSLKRAEWTNARVVGDDVYSQIAELKRGPGKDVAVFGSSALTASLLEAGLVDELRIMIHPILLGAGHSLLTSLHDRVPLALLRTTIFSSGNVLLCYRPGQASIR